MQGFSLVEVLISIIVLSFGLLGMVGLQAAALQANREARLQSVAYGLAQELADMMRGNKDIGVEKDSTQNPYLVALTSPLTPATPSGCLNVGSSGCTGATAQTSIAQSQMTEWLARVDAELPGARVAVCFDTAPFDAAGLPQWACTAPTGAAIATASSFIKIGWTRGSTNRAPQSAASALVRTSGADSRPGLVFPVISGRENNAT